MSQRKQVNLQIIDALRDYICKHPEQRFGQAIRNIGIVATIHQRILVEDAPTKKIYGDGIYFTNIFNEEPENTLTRIFKQLEEDNAGD